jgi:hypothetical protein
MGEAVTEPVVCERRPGDRDQQDDRPRHHGCQKELTKGRTEERALGYAGLLGHPVPADGTQTEHGRLGRGSGTVSLSRFGCLDLRVSSGGRGRF